MLRLVGFEGQAALQIAHAVDLQGATFTIGLQDAEVGMLARLNLATIPADEAGNARLKRLGADESLRESEGKREAPDARRPRDQVGMAGRAAVNVLPQHVDGPTVAQDLPVV